MLVIVGFLVMQVVQQLCGCKCWCVIIVWEGLFTTSIQPEVCTNHCMDCNVKIVVVRSSATQRMNISDFVAPLQGRLFWFGGNSKDRSWGKGYGDI